MSSVAARTSRAPRFSLRRNGQTPQTVLRNAFLVTFII